MISRLKGQLPGTHQFVLVPNTLDLQEFELSQIRDSEKEKKFKNTINILSYGVVSEQRGIQYVIAAIKKLTKKIPRLHLIILGDGSYLKVLKEMAKNLHVEKHVSFEGWQSQSKLISYMENTHITVIPHIKSEHTDNTSPNKLFHFMYFKKPIIVSDCNYIKEIVEEEQCGIIYPFEDTDALALALEKLYHNEGERKEMGERGFKAILSKYNWQTTVTPMIEIYPRI
jgi:glycosyltransferase involved in cell wall biosynthesis